LFRAVGHLHEAGITPTDSEGWFEADPSLPKRLFLEDSGFDGLDEVARGLGRELAQLEMNRLMLELAQDASSIQSTGQASFGDELESALGSFREGGYAPAVLLIPVSWRLTNAIGLAGFGGSGKDDPGGLVLPSGARHWYAGSTRGLWVVGWPSVPQDRMYLADLAAFGDWHQLPSREWLDVEVTSYNSDDALVLAQEQTADPVEARTRARELQESVRLSLRERFLLVRRDPRAVGWIEVPEDLRFEC
jgi:hypothetical protein